MKGHTKAKDNIDVATYSLPKFIPFLSKNEREKQAKSGFPRTK